MIYLDEVKANWARLVGRMGRKIPDFYRQSTFVVTKSSDFQVPSTVISGNRMSRRGWGSELNLKWGLGLGL